MSSFQTLTPGIAVVTGASSGIGRAAAISLAAKGWTCVLSGRRQAELEETANLAVAARETALPGKLAVAPTCVVGDLGVPSNILNLFKVVKEKYGRLDLLFNNAGINVGKVPLEDVPLEDFDSLININIRAPFLCTQEAFKIMSTQDPKGGRIINNGSISSVTPRPFSAPYTLSKHAITGLTKSTSLDGRAYGIACSQIDIGNAASAMSAKKSQGGTLQASGLSIAEPTYSVDYAGEAVAYMASLPLHVNVLSQTLMATNMPYVGRG